MRRVRSVTGSDSHLLDARPAASPRPTPDGLESRRPARWALAGWPSKCPTAVLSAHQPNVKRSAYCCSSRSRIAAALIDKQKAAEYLFATSEHQQRRGWGGVGRGRSLLACPTDSSQRHPQMLTAPDGAG